MQLRGRSVGFVRTEGGLLPADLLERVRSLDRGLPGLNEAAYGLASGDRFGEVITRSWNRLVGSWAAFADALGEVPGDDAGTTVTRERWLLPLMEALGYGRPSPARAVEIDGRGYPVSHSAGPVVLHLVGANVGLDERSKGVVGAARHTPHGLLQELLNRSPDRLWGIVSNGRTLRILRDNASLTRQAYVEFDLEAIMTGEAYADFALLWYVAHRSRLEPRHADDAPEGDEPRLASCYLELWSHVAVETGARARDRLRDGVEEAIGVLGRGFLAHPANSALRVALRTGDLTTQDLYRELLRLVYRLIFLFVAEDRDLLLYPEAGPAARERYARYYSTGRLRQLAERRRGSRHGDLYEGVGVVITALGTDDGAPGIGIAPLGGLLFVREACPHLHAAALDNASLLEAVRRLATIEERGVLRAVDYRNLGSEELGSIYESLLELHPQLDVDAHTFALATAAGHDRKTTGSYYTKTSLIGALLDAALDPVLDDASASPDPEAAILDLSVLDPAAGSGHFLVAAAHRLAKRLAQVRTGDEEPAPVAVRTALRDVISRCVYAVDVNPMAVELCKFNLWLEALEPGRPLSFLDSHVKAGNSLVWATQARALEGVPETAFKAVEGDDTRVVTSLRRTNDVERKGQLTLGELPHVVDLSALGVERTRLERSSDRVPADVRRKADAYQASNEDPALIRAHEVADGWCAAFFTVKVDPDDAITTATLRASDAAGRERLRRASSSALDGVGSFHWELEFPAVMARGGFDVVIGNPPWESLSPDAKEFFSEYDPNVRNASPEDQARVIARLLEDPWVNQRWSRYKRELYGLALYLRDGGCYTLYAPGDLGKGDFNTYRVFVELALRLARPGGYVGQIAPDGLYMGANASAIRKALLDDHDWRRLLAFENRKEVWFKDIDTRTRFCLVAAQIGGRSDTLEVAFTIDSEAGLLDVTRGGVTSVPAEVVRRVSPETYAVPEVKDAQTLLLIDRLLSRWPALGDESAGPPVRRYLRELDMGNDRDLFANAGELPLYEGRMVGQFDHRAKGYLRGRGRTAEWEDLPFGSSTKAIRPQWWVRESSLTNRTRPRSESFRIGFCDVTSPTNERSLVAALIPPGTISGDKVPTILLEGGHPSDYMVWLATANSLVMDWLMRRRVALKVSYTILDGMPFPRSLPRATTAPIVDLAARLTCASPEMIPFWDQLAAEGWVEAVSGGVIDPDERSHCRARLDALVAVRLFDVDEAEMDVMLRDFGALERRERREFGRFHTRDHVMDEMGRLLRTAQPTTSGRAHDLS